jgi:hypothetical protein
MNLKTAEPEKHIINLYNLTKLLVATFFTQATQTQFFNQICLYNDSLLII